MYSNQNLISQPIKDGIWCKINGFWVRFCIVVGFCIFWQCTIVGVGHAQKWIKNSIFLFFHFITAFFFDVLWKVVWVSVHKVSLQLISNNQQWMRICWGAAFIWNLTVTSYIEIHGMSLFNREGTKKSFSIWNLTTCTFMCPPLDKTRHNNWNRKFKAKWRNTEF